MSGYDFTLAGQTLTGVDDLGCEWHTEDAPGWFAGGAVRNGTEPRAQQSGDWRARGFRSGRVITLRGHVKAPSLTALEQACRRFSALLADGLFDELAGASPVGLLTSSVQLDDTPLWDPLSDTAAAWQITVGSELPMLFGAAKFDQTTASPTGSGAGLQYPRVYPLDYGVPAGVTPGSIAVPNDGTTSYHPRVRVDGPCTNPVMTLVETGDQVAYRGTLAAGQHLDINWGQVRRVTIGDNPVSVRNKTTITGNSLAVPVGGGSLRLSADSAGTGATLSAWFYEGAWS